MAFFNERVEDSKAADGWEWSVERVLDVINGIIIPSEHATKDTPILSSRGVTHAGLLT